MATLKVENVHTHFGGVRAVDGVDLDVRDGEFLVLLGASGSGKTTLMRTIAGLEKLTSGNVLIGGEVVNHLPPNSRNIAMPSTRTRACSGTSRSRWKRCARSAPP